MHMLVALGHLTYGQWQFFSTLFSLLLSLPNPCVYTGTRTRTRRPMHANQFFGILILLAGIISCFFARVFNHLVVDLGNQSLSCSTFHRLSNPFSFSRCFDCLQFLNLFWFHDRPCSDHPPNGRQLSIFSHLYASTSNTFLLTFVLFL